HSLFLTFSRLYTSSFFTASPTPHIYTLSLHDALPICPQTVAIDLVALEGHVAVCHQPQRQAAPPERLQHVEGLRKQALDVLQTLDRKSTRLNSSHDQITYAVFCLKKKKKKKKKRNNEK